MQYIQWNDASSWESIVELGNLNEQYKFSARWNTFDNNWYISIFTIDDIPVINSKRLILRQNLFVDCNKTNIPFCILYPDTTDENIQSITYEHMTNSIVKLFHITIE